MERLFALSKKNVDSGNDVHRTVVHGLHDEPETLEVAFEGVELRVMATELRVPGAPPRIPPN